MKLIPAILFCALVFGAGMAQSGERHADVRQPRAAWTLADTVAAAVSYAPSVKREQEGVAVQQENVRQAEAGHLPRVDVEASTGASTLPVSKYE